MPLIETKGAASAQGFGEFAASSGAVTYIEDVFSTYLYTGTSTSGQTQTITNGIDLSTKGGLTIIKSRAQTTPPSWFDTSRGVSKYLWSNGTQGTNTFTGYGLTSFNTSGFNVTDLNSANDYYVNVSGQNYVSWTFRKQPKFFDVVTWTGDGTVGRTIAHNLGSTPGCIIVKCTNNTTKWAVWHRSGTQSNRYGAFLNTTDAYTDTLTNLWGAAGGTPAMTSTSFSVGDAITTNDYFNTYVAYVFAHNAGGFGLTGTDNVISCGTFTTDASGYADVNLGYEPQWILMKASSAAENWITVDNMRGLVGTGTDYKAARLYPNLSNAEASLNTCQISSTGFKAFQSTSVTYIYIAIRRGPMKVPTDATKVFAPVAVAAGSAPYDYAGFPVDLAMKTYHPGGLGTQVFDRLRGWTKPSGGQQLITASTAAETTGGGNAYGDYSTGWFSSSFFDNVFWNFQRAPSFFDEVCYTGTGGVGSQNHNLGAIPELQICKSRNATQGWGVVYNPSNSLEGLLNSNAALANGGTYTATTTAFQPYWNTSGNTYVAYLFATCAGVSKVGSYTGTGATQTISCGFTGGARFVLVKRTDSTGDWYVWDTARGMVAGTDPSLLLNSTAAQVNVNSIYTTTGGFQIVSTAAGINASGGTYIFLAIA